MNKLISVIIISLIAISLSAQEMTAGVWSTGEENTQIETYQKDGLWYGKIIFSDNPKAKIGKIILKDFVKADDKWKGELYAAKRDKLMDAVIIPSSVELIITVYAGFIKKNLTWTRVDNN